MDIRTAIPCRNFAVAYEAYCDGVEVRSNKKVNTEEVSPNFQMSGREPSPAAGMDCSETACETKKSEN